MGFGYGTGMFARPRKMFLLTSAALLALGACGDDSDQQQSSDATDPESGGGQHINVSFKGNNCEIATTKLPGGEVTFDVQNDGSSVVKGFQLLSKNETVLGEVQNLALGEMDSFTVELEGGEYLGRCPGADQETTALLVTTGDVSPEQNPATGGD